MGDSLYGLPQVSARLEKRECAPNSIRRHPDQSGCKSRWAHGCRAKPFGLTFLQEEGIEGGEDECQYTLFESEDHDAPEAEEELFVHDNRAIWSAEGRVKLQVSTRRQIKDWNWCRFPALSSGRVLALLLGDSVLFQPENEEASEVSLPCRCDALWPTPYGAVVRDASAGKLGTERDQQPLFWSISSPLLGPFPLRFLCGDPSADAEALVWTNELENIALAYSHSMQAHGLWYFCTHTNGLQTSGKHRQLEARLSWLDTSHSSSGPGEKAFLAHDESGRQMLCWREGERNELRLCLLREKEGAMASLEHFGSVEALEALPLGTTRDHGQKDILTQVLDGSFTLFRGAEALCKVALPGIGESLPKHSPSSPLVLHDAVGPRFTASSLVGGHQHKSESFSKRFTLILGPNDALARACMESVRAVLSRDHARDFERLFLQEIGIEYAFKREAQWRCFQRALRRFVGGSSTWSEFSEDDTSLTDWEALLRSDMHKWSPHYAALDPQESSELSERMSSVRTLQRNEVDGKRGMEVLRALHSIFEDVKLDHTRWWQLEPLGKLLAELASSINQFYYVELYVRCGVPGAEEYLQEVPTREGDDPPDVMKALEALLRLGDLGPHASKEHAFTFWEHTRTLLQCFEALGRSTSNRESAECLLATLVEHNATVEFLSRLPAAIQGTILDTLSTLSNDPPAWATGNAAALIRRWDISLGKEGSFTMVPFEMPILARERERSRRQRGESTRRAYKVRRYGSPLATAKGDGMEHMLASVGRLRFKNDVRILEVKRLLSSSQVLALSESSDDTVSQQHQLWLRAVRTTALPVGRGAYTVYTCRPFLAEPVEVPQIALMGRLPHQNDASVNLDLQAAGQSTSFSMWPSFHNGVAAGLRVAGAKEHLERTSVVFNRPSEPTHLHAGTLLAMGLAGNLGSLSAPDVYGYLKQEHEATSAALLLGLAATHRGSMNPSVSKVLFLHLPGKHPPSYPTVEVAPLVQSSSLFAVGLLYQGSAHRLMCEIMLSEVASRSSPHLHNESMADKEGHALSAGFGLGFITLGFGRDGAPGLYDLGLEESLCLYMLGGRDPAASSSGSMPWWKSARAHSDQDDEDDELFNRRCGLQNLAEDSAGVSGSGLVLESSFVHTDVTSPAATIALGLMFLKTGDEAVAERISVPSTGYELSRVRPDFTMLRALMRSLVLWDAIRPSSDWLKDQLPPLLRGYLAHNVQHKQDVSSAQVEACAFATAGNCLAMGLRYAGSLHSGAASVLKEQVEGFLRLKAKGSLHVDKQALETCADACVLGMSLVLAGSGDLDALRLLRYMHSRLEPVQAGGPTHGQHMAVGLAIGFIFLGGSAHSFKNDKPSVAALLAAVYPKFPQYTQDHRAHLQPLRHMYCLAAERRLFSTREASTGQELSAQVEVDVVPCDASCYEGGTWELESPCLLPPKSAITGIRVTSQSHYSVSLFGERLNEALASGSIPVKRVCTPTSKLLAIAPALDRSSKGSRREGFSLPTAMANDDDAQELMATVGANEESSRALWESLGPGLEELAELCSQCSGRVAEAARASIQSCIDSSFPEFAPVHLSLLSHARDVQHPSSGQSCSSMMEAMQLNFARQVKRSHLKSMFDERSSLPMWLVEAPAIQLEGDLEDGLPEKALWRFVIDGSNEHALQVCRFLGSVNAPSSKCLANAVHDAWDLKHPEERTATTLASCIMRRCPTCSPSTAATVAFHFADDL